MIKPIFRWIAAIAFLAVILPRPEPPAPPTPVAIVSAPAVTPSQLVDVAQVAPSIRLDMRYATTNNFMGKQLYPVARCLLRPPVAQALAKVQAVLEQEGLSLKLWDCYRPLSIQEEMWAIVPDPRYVANPNPGSKHNRGAAVDLTLVGKDGAPLEMPTEFDDFSEKASPDHPGMSPTAQSNSRKLSEAMTQHGFSSIPTEWWHFDGADSQSFDVLGIPLK